ncbi:MAG TPA: carboxymuconolactone decarboxylase family protein, partial [Paenarthrobacter sp.]|nr:carboxymuconolactone decarboxylase family protein [Paenarthrobacter sp.]
MEWGHPRNYAKEKIMSTEEQETGWTGGKNAFGDFAPGMVHYTDKVLFDEVWERAGLSKRDRSLVTVAALTATGKLDQLKFHLGFARRNGVTDDELKEALLQLSFYTGWPNGMGATTVLKNIIEDEDWARASPDR